MIGDASSISAQFPGEPPWVRCLGPDAPPNPAYLDACNDSLAAILRRAPRRVLELGCSAGLLGERLRAAHPGVHFTGVEMDRDAVRVARTRLDHVIAARLEDVDFAAEGIAPESIDTLIAGDVLEHLHDPWRVLVRARSLLTPDAQVAVSLPNVRNLAVHAVLHNEGSWRYEDHGLLDITHIRFFTLRDAVRMMNETGYRVLDVKSRIDIRYADLYAANAGNPAVTIQVGKLKLENLTSEELQEYCTLQYLVLAEPQAAGRSDAPATIPA
jgi:trans-aconitate methyltransferase